MRDTIKLSSSAAFNTWAIFTALVLALLLASAIVSTLSGDTDSIILYPILLVFVAWTLYWLRKRASTVYLTTEGIKTEDQLIPWPYVLKIRLYLAGVWQTCVVRYRREDSQDRLLFFTTGEKVLATRIFIWWERSVGRSKVKLQRQTFPPGSLLQAARA